MADSRPVSSRLGRWARPAAGILLAGAGAILVRAWLVAPVPAEVVRPSRGLVVQEAFGTGTLEAKVVVGASAKMVGKVVEVLADQGDMVAAGQCLARLESMDYEDSVRVAEARQAQAAAELAKARADFERTRALFDERIVSQAELDAQQTALSVAEARLETARAERGFASARLTDTRIVSPIQGLVVTRNLEVGSTVVPGSPIFRVADTRLLWVQAMVDEREAGGLRVGAPARVVFRADPGTSLPGSLSRLAREADRVTEELQADVKLDRLPAAFALGQKADVWVETARKEHALLVPRSALVPRGQTPGVYVVETGRARWRAVKLGLQGRDAAEVLEGLREEDLMAREPLRGKQPLTEGRRVTASEGARP